MGKLHVNLRTKNRLHPFKNIAAATLIGLSIVCSPFLANGQQIIEIEVPPVYDTIYKKVVTKPAHLKQVEVPAEYTTVTSRRLVRACGGFREYREMPCLKPISDDAPIPVEAIQKKLKTLGFYWGPIDNILGPKTKSAVIEYRKVKALGDGFKITPYMLDMLGVTAIDEG